MDDLCTYFIEVSGRVDEKDLAAMSPIRMMAAPVEAGDALRAASTQFRVCTDQSGLIGMLRYLHGRGLVFLSIDREG